MFFLLVSDCDVLDDPISGFINVLTTVSVYGSVEVRAVARVSCLSGFNVSGESELVCLPNGEWSSPIPECGMLQYL